MVEWDLNLFGPPAPSDHDESTHPDNTLRPVHVKNYIKVSYNLRDSKQDHLLLAVVSWLLPHPMKYEIGNPAQVWHHNLYESGGVSSFVPVQYLRSRCCHCVTTVRGTSVMVIVPLVE